MRLNLAGFSNLRDFRKSRFRNDPGALSTGAPKLTDAPMFRRCSSSDGCPKPTFRPKLPVQGQLDVQRCPEPPVQGQLDIQRCPILPFQDHLFFLTIKDAHNRWSRANLTFKSCPKLPVQSQLDVQRCPRPPVQGQLDIQRCPKPPVQGQLEVQKLPKVAGPGSTSARSAKLLFLQAGAVLSRVRRLCGRTENQ